MPNQLQESYALDKLYWYWLELEDTEPASMGSAVLISLDRQSHLFQTICTIYSTKYFLKRPCPFLKCLVIVIFTFILYFEFGPKWALQRQIESNNISAWFSGRSMHSTHHDDSTVLCVQATNTTISKQSAPPDIF